MEPTLDEMIALARGAGEILREGYGKQHQVNRKGKIDLVTEMDGRSEAYLIEHIRARFPEDTIETEESGLLTGAKRARWYVDPLDGTTNYAHGVPSFSVSLAYGVDGQVRLGVVYDPMRDECFSAELGQGARCNDELIQVSGAAEMIHSLLVTGFPYDPSAVKDGNLSAFAHFTRISQGVRRFGSAALDLSYVAAGRFDGYWELTLKPWDFAAGALIVQEAGGQVTSPTGESDLFRPPYAILAGTPIIQAQMLAEFSHLF